ncbi:MAG: glycosyltransferase family 2 protein [Hydrogenobaculum sp.]
MIDILLSTYDGEKFLRDFIKSLDMQTYKDWRLIIRDDGSIDSTKKILEEIRKANPSKFIILEDDLGNIGAYRSFFELLRKSSANYIMFADQDDVWLPQKIEKTLKKMLDLEKSFGSNVPILVHTDLQIVNENLDLIYPSFWKYRNQNPEYKALNYLIVQNNITGCTIMLNYALKELIRKIPEKAIMHDWWVALVASAFGIIDYIPDQTVLYRQHSNQNIGAKKYSINFFYNEFIKKPSNAVLSFNKTVDQAINFLEIYKEKLSKDQIDIFTTYINLKNESLIKKLKNIVKHKFFKQGKIKNIGFILTVLFLSNKYFLYEK